MNDLKNGLGGPSYSLPCPQCMTIVPTHLQICPKCGFNLTPNPKKAKLSPSALCSAIIRVCVDTVDVFVSQVTNYLGEGIDISPKTQLKLRIQLLTNNLALARVLLPTGFPDYAKINRLIREYDKVVEGFFKETVEEKRLRKLVTTGFKLRSNTLWEAATDGSLQHVLPMTLQALLEETFEQSGIAFSNKQSPSIESDIFYGNLGSSFIDLMTYYFKLTQLE